MDKMNAAQLEIWEQTSDQPVEFVFEQIYKINSRGDASFTPKYTNKKTRNALQSLLLKSNRAPGGFKHIPCLDIVEQTESDTRYYGRDDLWRVISERYWVVRAPQ